MQGAHDRSEPSCRGAIHRAHPRPCLESRFRKRCSSNLGGYGRSGLLTRGPMRKTIIQRDDSYKIFAFVFIRPPDTFV